MLFRSRFEAFSNLGIESWVFWVYDFAQNGYSYDDSLRTFQLQENDHVAALPSSISDVANTISRLIKDGSKLVENTEDSIRAYVDTYCKNMHPQTKAKIVRQTMSLAGTYRAIITYTAKDAREWIDTNTDYTHDGIYDPKRKAFGWSVKEGYDYDAIVNAIKKYSLEGKESYFVLHTKSPTAKSTIHDKRESLMSAFTAWETYLVDVVEYYNENGHFPWHVEAFLPQDQENEDSKELVSVDDYI